MAAPDAKLQVTVQAKDEGSTVFKKTEKNIKDLNKTLKDGKKKVKEYDSQFKKMALNFGRYLVIYKGAMMALDGIVSAMKAGIESSLTFEQALSQVSSIAFVNKQTMAELREGVENLSKTMGIDATEATKGLYRVISGGIREPAKAMEVLGIGVKLAKTGVTDLESAVKALTNVMVANNSTVAEAKVIADQLFASVVFGDLKFQELAPSIAKTIQVTKNLGVGLPEVLGMISSLTKTAGVTAQKASTQVTRAMLSIMTPSPTLAKALNAVNKQLGTQFKTGQDLVKHFNGKLQPAFQLVRDAVEAQDLSLFKAMRRVEGFNALLGVTGENAQKAADDIKRVEESLGLLDRGYAEIQKSNTERLAKFKNAFMFVMRRIGTFFTDSFLAILDNLKIIFNSLGITVDNFAKGLETLASVIDLTLITPLRKVSLVAIGLRTIFDGIITVVTAIGSELAKLGKIVEIALSGNIRERAGELKDVFASLGDDLSISFDEDMKNMKKRFKEWMEANKHTGGRSGEIFGSGFMKGLKGALTELPKILGDDDDKKPKPPKKELNKSLNDALGSILRISNTFKVRLAAAIRKAAEDPKILEGIKSIREKLDKSVISAAETAIEDPSKAVQKLRERLAALGVDLQNLFKKAKDEVDKINKDFEDQQNILGAQAGMLGQMSSAFGTLSSETERFNSSLAKSLDKLAKAAQILQNMVLLNKSLKALEDAKNIAGAAGTVAKLGAVGGIFGAVAGMGAGILGMFHNGGSIQRLHNGGVPNRLSAGEVPIIAQTGEYMLSRRAVQNMGGTQAVDSMHRNAQAGAPGGGTNVHLNLAFDPDNFRSFITGTAEGRDIIKNAVVGAFPT